MALDQIPVYESRQTITSYNYRYDSLNFLIVFEHSFFQ